MTTFFRPALSVAAVAFTLLAACDEPSDDPDGAVEGCPELEPFPSGGDGATALAVPPAEGHAVAGRITSESQLLEGLKPRGRVGDVLLANDRVAVVIEDARPSDGYGTAGGEILDVDLVGPDGPLGETLFGELLVGILPEVLAPEEVTVVADGSDGGEAVVRAAGHLAAMWLIEDCCRGIFPGAYGFPAYLDYALAPGAAAIELRLTVRNTTTVLERPESILTVLLGGDGARRYAPSVGFDEDESFGSQDWVGLVGDRIGYAWVPATGDVRYLLTYSGFHLYDSAGTDLPGCEDTSIVVGHIVVADGEVSAVQAAMREGLDDAALPAITGQVTEVDGTTVESARLHLVDGEGGHVSMARSAEDGTFRIEAAPGEYVLHTWVDDRRGPAPIAVSLSSAGATVDAELPPSGLLQVTVLDGEGSEIPAKLSIVPLDDPAPSAPSTFGEWRHPEGAMHHGFALPGTYEVRLTAGRYRVTASRGYEYEVDDADFDVEAGGTAEVALALPRSVDTTGWVTGDFHVHTMYSPDSSDLLDWKVAASAAMGLEIPVCTDHRWVGDLQPTVERLGLEDWVQWFPGHELTTFIFGHFNAYPLEPRPEEPNMGAFDVAGRTPLELFEQVWSSPDDPILQINHPRGMSVSAYFSYVGLDPESLEVERPEGWSTDFDAIEVFNDSDWLDNRDGTVRDWFGMLAHGHLVTAMGNSDSHDAEWSDVGYPRNYLNLGTDDPTEVTREMLRDASRSGHVVVSGGLFVTVDADGAGPGDVAAAEGGTAVFTIRVQAPTWMDADLLEIFVDGVSVELFELDESTEDPENPVVRFDREMSMELGGDGWIVVAAWSEGSLAPATPGARPFGVTNAIYFDADGDGEYRDSGRTVR